MWVLVVIFVMDDTMSVRSMDYVYKDKYVCEQHASSLYYDYMATRPDKSYNVISYCSQIPKGV